MRNLRLPATPLWPLNHKNAASPEQFFQKDTSEPLSKAKVQLVNREKWEESTFDITDSQGNFQLSSLDCQSYLLRVSHPGFVLASYGQQTSSDPGAVLSLTRGQNMFGLVFKLQKTAVVTGRVFDETGQLRRGFRYTRSASGAKANNAGMRMPAKPLPTIWGNSASSTFNPGTIFLRQFTTRGSGAKDLIRGRVTNSSRRDIR